MPSNPRSLFRSTIRHLTLSLLALCLSLWMGSGVALAAPPEPQEPRFLDPYGKIELGVGFPLRAPQSDYFWPGFGGRLNVGLGLGQWFSLQATAQLVALPDRAAAPARGAAVPIGFGGGFRVKLPYRYLASPWIDFDLLYVRTGTLDRLGYTLGLGLHFPLGEQRIVRLGPFLRLFQVIDTDAPQTNSTDGMVLIAGLSVEVGVPHPRTSEADRAAAAAAAAEAEAAARAAREAEEAARAKALAEAAAKAADRDHDGVPDETDRCPDQAGAATAAGCPDADGDTVADDKDRCPDKAGTAPTFGCPDRDADGIADADDKCADQAGPVITAGCPDRDTDGIADADDRCPDAAGKPEHAGCAEPKVELQADKIDLGEKVFFDTGRATIQPRSFPLLDEVAKVLTSHPKIKIRVEGHTDDQGARPKNLKLSKGRADAVKAYLVKHGVAANRVVALGFGATRPLAPNQTNDGREKNRRVEILVVASR